jgi:ligand-binding sensor domain-containing protein
MPAPWFLSQGDGKNELLSNVIRKIHLDGKGRLWIGTLKGLNILHIHTGQIESYVHNPTDKNTLNFNSIYDIFRTGRTISGLQLISVG